jgi:DNA-binding HxlR family transcriptional regulator
MKEVVHPSPIPPSLSGETFGGDAPPGPKEVSIAQRLNRSQSQLVIMSGSRFARAFNDVLSHDLDRRLLLELRSAGRELRYEELRRRVGGPAPEAFSRAVERLSKAALVKRRLARLEAQRRYGSWLSPSSRGLVVAMILHGLSSSGTIPTSLSKEIRTAVLEVFRGRTATEAPAV